MKPPLQMLYDEPPQDGQIEEVAPGVHWLRMPLPMVGLNHINLWILEDGDGLTVVDTGVKSDTTQAIWENLLQKTFIDRPVKRLICTHFHPDHMGFAGWFTEVQEAEFWTSRCEWMLAMAISSHRGENWLDAARKFYQRAGADQEATKVFVEGESPYVKQVWPIPPAFHRISDGDEFTIGTRSWRVITGHGHSPEHVCLYTEGDKILIAGDIILPRISPNQGVWPSEPDNDPLSEYLLCLDKFAALPEDTIILPSHGIPFRGLKQRIESLKHHHDDRLEVAQEACKNGATAWDITGVLFDPNLPGMHKVLALSETLAHLNRLISESRITRTLTDDTWIYKAV